MDTRKLTRPALLLPLLLLCGGGCEWFFGLEKKQAFSVGGASGLGGEGNDRALGVVMSKAGASYVVGSFTSKTVTLGATPLTRQGSESIFLLMLDQERKIGWARSLGGEGRDRAWGVALGGDNDLYIVGHFDAPITFDTVGQLSPYSHTGGTPADTLFVARLDLSTGKFVWAKRLGITGSSATLQRQVNITMGAADTLYVAGGFIYSTELDPVGTGVASAGDEDAFVARLTRNGKVLWARLAGGAGTDRFHGLVNDGSGGVVVTGFFERTATFRGSSTTLTSAGERDVVVARYDASGGLSWASQAGGSRSDQGNAVDRDPSADTIVVAGAFNSADATFGALDKVSSAGRGDVFVTKMDSAGKFGWVTTGGGPADDAALGLTADNNGNAMITGYFQGNATFGSKSLVSRGAQDMYLLRLSSTGEEVFFAPVGGDNTISIGRGVVIAANKRALAVGSFDGDLAYGGVDLKTAGKEDILLLHLVPTGGGATPLDAGPDSSRPDASRKDGAQPDMADKDSAQPDAVIPDSTAPDADMKDSSQPDKGQPDKGMPDLQT